MGCFIEGTSNSYLTKQVSLCFGDMQRSVDLNYGRPIEVEGAQAKAGNIVQNMRTTTLICDCRAAQITTQQSVLTLRVVSRAGMYGQGHRAGNNRPRAGQLNAKVGIKKTDSYE